MSEQVMTVECDGTQDLFTPEFKCLKARSPLPDLSKVIDLSNYDLDLHCSFSPVDKGICQYPVRSCSLKPVSGLKPLKEWKCYQFINYPGLIIIQNPFVDGYQRYWVYQCLQDFVSNRGSVTNLTSVGDDSSRGLWYEFVNKQSCEFDKHDPLRKLRWTTLGYHYNWTTKEYSEDHKAPFPADVNCLSQYLAACLGFAPFQAEAAIVNYYHLDSTLAGHTDHSEIDHSAPLFSISFGQTAIFLLGGHTKSVKPMSVFLRSGDICVMSGECRLAYHAVPKILPPSPDKPIPHCFNLTHVSHCAMHNAHAPSSVHQNFCIDCSKMKTCEPNLPSHGSNCDSLFSSTETHTLLQCENSQNNYCNTTDRQICDKSTIAARNVSNLTDKDKLECDVYVNNYNSNIDTVNYRIKEIVTSLDFKPFEVYLASSRINLNVRQVLPSGCTSLQSEH